MKCGKSSILPLHRILLSNEFRSVLRLLGKKARDRISAEMKAEYENQIAICLKETAPRRSLKEMAER